MIEVHSLCKYFNGKLAVDNVSFHVGKGKTLVLLGTSGSGKTTTLKMINRLIEPSSGSIIINGRDIRKQKPELLRQQIGYVIQSIGLFPHYTVWQNIGLVPQLLKWPPRRIRERSQELLAMLGLPEDIAERYPAELSGGQQQRVGLARALAADPPVILMDEPFGALDPITKRQIQAEFEQLDTLKSKTLVMVTHDVFEAVVLADEIALMDHGCIQQIGTPKELLFAPKNDFVRSFFDTQRFRLELQVIQLQDILPEIPATSAENHRTQEDKAVSMPVQSSLLEVLECMEKSNVRFVRPQDHSTTTPVSATVSRDTLLHAFYQVKANLKKQAVS